MFHKHAYMHNMKRDRFYDSVILLFMLYYNIVVSHTSTTPPPIPQKRKQIYVPLVLKLTIMIEVKGTKLEILYVFTTEI